MGDASTAAGLATHVNILDSISWLHLGIEYAFDKYYGVGPYHLQLTTKVTAPTQMCGGPNYTKIVA